MKNEIITLSVAAIGVPFIIPVYIGYHFFFKKTSWYINLNTRNYLLVPFCFLRKYYE